MTLRRIRMTAWGLRINVKPVKLRYVKLRRVELLLMKLHRRATG